MRIPAKAVCTLQGATKDEEGFDLVHLCSIFASDPYVMAFAKLIESGTSRVILYHRCSASPVWQSVLRAVCGQAVEVTLGKVTV